MEGWEDIGSVMELESVMESTMGGTRISNGGYDGRN